MHKRSQLSCSKNYLILKIIFIPNLLKNLDTRLVNDHEEIDLHKRDFSNNKRLQCILACIFTKGKNFAMWKPVVDVV